MVAVVAAAVASTGAYAHCESAVMDVMETCETWVRLARASPRKPKVQMEDRSSYEVILLVVKRSHRIGKSPERIPHPSSWICTSARARW